MPRDLLVGLAIIVVGAVAALFAYFAIPQCDDEATLDIH